MEPGALRSGRRSSQGRTAGAWQRESPLPAVCRPGSAGTP